MDRVLEKFGIELDELLEPAGALEARLVRSQLPAEAVAGARSGSGRALETGYAVLERARDRDRSDARPARQAAQQQALAGTQDVEKKLVQHLKRRQETELGQMARARTAVCPNGKPQERVLTLAPFLARYWPGAAPGARATPSRRGTARP